MEIQNLGWKFKSDTRLLIFDPSCFGGGAELILFGRLGFTRLRRVGYASRGVGDCQAD